MNLEWHLNIHNSNQGLVSVIISDCCYQPMAVSAIVPPDEAVDIKRGDAAVAGDIQSNISLIIVFVAFIAQFVFALSSVE
jgi:hypothetical protein